MKAKPFTDAILGDFEPDKKGTTKTHFSFIRKAKLTLHRVHAQDYYDESGKKQLIYGEVVLVERKTVCRNTSVSSLFQTVEKTPNSVIEDIIV